MKFRIITENFDVRGEATPYGTIPLRSRVNRRDFFLDIKAADLLSLPEGEHDFDELFGSCDPRDRRAFLDGLTLLSAFGVAEVSAEEPEGPICCRVAGERDYRDISKLLTGEDTVRMGVVPADKVYMSEDNIRARQFNNDEYNFIYTENGEIKGVLIACMPQAGSFSAAFRLCGIAIARGCDPDMIIGPLFACAKDAFRDEFRICRYLCFAEDDPFAERLTVLGFRETAKLSAEAEDGGDVTVYDLEVAEC